MAEQEEKRLIQSGETEQGKTEGHRADRLAGCIIIALLAGMLPCPDAAAGDMAEWANPRNIRTCSNIQSRHLPESNFQTRSGSEETVEAKNGIKKNGNTVFKVNDIDEKDAIDVVMSDGILYANVIKKKIYKVK